MLVYAVCGFHADFGTYDNYAEAIRVATRYAYRGAYVQTIVKK